MCRALKVLCVAEDVETLTALRRATVSSSWELTPGGVGAEEGVRLLHEERPHVAVAWGDLGAFTSAAAEAYPGLRIVADRALPGVAVTVASMEEIRDAIVGRARPGPVR